MPTALSTKPKFGIFAWRADARYWKAEPLEVYARESAAKRKAQKMNEKDATLNAVVRPL